MNSSKFPTHIALKRDEMDRLQAYGRQTGVDLSPRQVLLLLLTEAEKRLSKQKNKVQS